VRKTERGVKVRPRGRTLRDMLARGKGPIVKGGRGHYWERKRGVREREKQNETHAHTIYWAAADGCGKCFPSKITLAE